MESGIPDGASGRSDPLTRSLPSAGALPDGLTGSEAMNVPGRPSFAPRH